MATPSDLIEHYSSRAFLTRIAALTSVGAVVGAVINKLDEPDTSALVGIALISIVISLAELNRRYTNSYISACRAAAKIFDSKTFADAKISDSDRKELGSAKADALRWNYFRCLNEKPYESTKSRFFLNWLTYLPGLVLGVFLILKSCRGWAMHIGYRISIAVLVLIMGILVIGWWWRSSDAASDSQKEGDDNQNQTAANSQ